MQMLVYQIRNTVTGQKYFGQTTRKLRVRWREHVSELKRRTHGNRYLQAAWDKYGSGAFECSIYRQVGSYQEMNQVEIEAIAGDPLCYNLTVGGKTLHHHLAHSKKQIGEAHKIKVIGMSLDGLKLKIYPSATDTAKDGFNGACVRKCCSKSIAYRKTGQFFTSLSHKGFVWMNYEDYTRPKMNLRAKYAKTRKTDLSFKGRVVRPLISKCLTTSVIVKYKDGREVEKSGFSSFMAYNCCDRKTKSHRNFVWAYADLPETQSLLQAAYEAARRRWKNTARYPNSARVSVNGRSKTGKLVKRAKMRSS